MLRRVVFPKDGPCLTLAIDISLASSRRPPQTQPSNKEASVSRFASLSASLVLLLLSTTASGTPFPGQILQGFLSSTVPESGYTGPQNLSSYPLTATPYDFTNQLSFALVSVDALFITLQVGDGDSAPGDFDFNNLYLALDGINAGLALNGFPDSQILSLSLNQLPVSVSDALVAALQQDWKWIGSVVDLTPGNAPAGDTIAFPIRLDTTLDAVVTYRWGILPPPPSVPLPAALLLALPALGAAGLASRRFRRSRMP
jgi:hypothetical protein